MSRRLDCCATSHQVAGGDTIEAIMTLKTLVLRPSYARRLPDPVFNTDPAIYHHIFWVPASTLADGVSYGPNARNPNSRKQVYKKVDDSLMNVDCLPNTFHLKNLGIFIMHIPSHASLTITLRFTCQMKSITAFLMEDIRLT